MPSVSAVLEPVGLDLSMRVLVVFHRGRTAVPSGAHEIVGDRRRLTESADSLRALAPVVVIDAC